MSWSAPGRVAVRVDGRLHRLHTGLAGRDLARAAADGNWMYLINPGLVEQDRQALLLRVVDPADWFDLPHLYAVALILAEHVYGVEWHVATRLCWRAEAQWVTFHGWCLTRRLDPRALAGDEVCAVVWAWIADRLAWADGDETKRVRNDVWGIADNHLELIQAGIIFPPSQQEQPPTQQESAAWGLPAPDSTTSQYPEW